MGLGRVDVDFWMLGLDCEDVGPDCYMNVLG